jgi:hypothetical protein
MSNLIYKQIIMTLSLNLNLVIIILFRKIGIQGRGSKNKHSFHIFDVFP